MGRRALRARLRAARTRVVRIPHGLLDGLLDAIVRDRCDASRDRLARDGDRDRKRHRPQPRDRREQQAGGALFGRHERRERFRRGIRHPVRDLRRAHGERAEPEPREDEHVVALAHADIAARRTRRRGTGYRSRRGSGNPSTRRDPAGFASEFALGFDDGKITGRSTCAAISRTSRSSNAPATPDRPINIVGRHLRTTSRACGRRVPSRPAALRERRGPRELALVRVLDSAVVDDEAAAIEHRDDRRAAVRAVDAFLRELRLDLPRHAEPGRARAVDHDALLGEPLAA